MVATLNPAQGNTRIIFVHGLGSSSEKTWIGSPALPEVAEDVLQCEPLYYSYPTKKLRFNIFRRSKPKIQQLSLGLRSFVELRAEGANVVLVCHSMGGLVAKKMLVDLAQQQVSLGIAKLLLFGTPNNGSELADVAKLLSLRNHQLEQLSPNSDFIEELNKDWQALNMAEMIDTHYLVGGEDVAVTMRSATGQWGSNNVTTIIGADHSGVAAPDSNEHLGVVRLRKELSEFVELPAIDDSSRWLAEAQRLASKGVVTQANKAFERACVGDDLVALRERAKFLRQIGRDQQSYDLNRYMIDLPAWIEDDSDTAKADRALVLANMGIIKRKQGQLDDSERDLRDAVNSVVGSRDQPMREAEAYCRDNLGHTLLKESRPDDALEQFEISLGLRGELDEPSLLARSHLNLARLYKSQGEFERAFDQASRAISALTGLEAERRNLANAYICLGEIQIQYEHFDAAAESIKAGIDINEAIQNRDGAAIGWMKLGQAHIAGGFPDEAAHAVDRALHINKDLDNSVRVREAEALLAAISVQRRTLGSSE